VYLLSLCPISSNITCQVQVVGILIGPSVGHNPGKAKERKEKVKGGKDEEVNG